MGGSWPKCVNTLVNWPEATVSPNLPSTHVRVSSKSQEPGKLDLGWYLGLVQGT